VGSAILRCIPPPFSSFSYCSFALLPASILPGPPFPPVSFPASGPDHEVIPQDGFVPQATRSAAASCEILPRGNSTASSSLSENIDKYPDCENAPLMHILSPIWNLLIFPIGTKNRWPLLNPFRSGQHFSLGSPPLHGGSKRAHFAVGRAKGNVLWRPEGASFVSSFEDGRSSQVH
jgi:hypothetical protein